MKTLHRHHCDGVGVSSVSVLFCLLLSVWMATLVSGSSTNLAESSKMMLNDLANGQPEHPETGRVVVRFCFVRHGQTNANLDGTVVGQLDSPLTELGIQQAQAAGKSAFLPKSYWRRYSSDLGRAQQTAQLILQSQFGLLDKEGVNDNIDLQLLVMEKRLRERGKGVREGLSKTLTYQQALELRKDEDQSTLPLYETEDQVWDRVQDWLYQVVGDAVRQYHDASAQEQQEHDVASGKRASVGDKAVETAGDTTTDGIPTTTASRGGTTTSAASTVSEQEPRVYCVFCLSHSGALRAVIRKLVASQLPSSIDLTPAGLDGAKPGMLYIPNSSITIIDIVPKSLNLKTWKKQNDGKDQSTDYENLWRANLVELTQASHLDAL